MAKKTILILVTVLLFSSLSSQSLSQLGFVIKKALPNVETIAVFFNKTKEKQMESEAKPAIIITKKRYIIYPVESRSEIASKLYEVGKLDNTVVVVIADESVLTTNVVNYMSQRLTEFNIPLVSNREKDTLQGAFLSIFLNDKSIQKHINMLMATALSLEVPEEFLSECEVDVE